MKIYKLSQTINKGFGTYDSAVVIAENELSARRIHPDVYEDRWFAPTWVRVSEIDQIRVDLIGEAVAGMESGVVVASWDAG